MAFPIALASTLTGVTPHQLASWRQSGLLVPEVSTRPVLYSFRDLLALRTFAKLRSVVSLQKIRKAFDSLRTMDLTDHPSKYHLIDYLGSVALIEEDGEGWDLVEKPGQGVITSLSEVYAPFTNFRGDSVVDMRHPSTHLEVRETRLGGWPTIARTRVPYDTISTLVANGVPATEIHYLYSRVDEAAALDAAAFQERVTHTRQTVSA